MIENCLRGLIVGSCFLTALLAATVNLEIRDVNFTVLTLSIAHRFKVSKRFKKNTASLSDMTLGILRSKDRQNSKNQKFLQK